MSSSLIADLVSGSSLVVAIFCASHAPLCFGACELRVGERKDCLALKYNNRDVCQVRFPAQASWRVRVLPYVDVDTTKLLETRCLDIICDLAETRVEFLPFARNREERYS